MNFCRECNALSNDPQFEGVPDWLLLVRVDEEGSGSGPHVAHERYRCKLSACGATWTRTVGGPEHGVEWSVYAQAL